MTAKKLWADLAPRTREVRFSSIAANHLPRTDRVVVPQTARHARCQQRGACTGPGCRVSR